MAEMVQYVIGEVVEVHAFGHWYAGQVVKLGRKRVTVRYASGTGTIREKAVSLAGWTLPDGSRGSLIRKRRQATPEEQDAREADVYLGRVEPVKGDGFEQFLAKNGGRR